MAEATCKTCPWYAPFGFDHGDRGECENPHPDHNGLVVIGNYDWCGEHPERKTNATPQSECERLGYHVCGPDRKES